MSKSVGEILQDSGIEQPGRKEQMEESVTDLITRIAEKAATQAATSAADKSVDKCNQFWQTKISGLAAAQGDAGYQDSTTPAAATTSADGAKTEEAAKSAKAKPAPGTTSSASAAEEACMQTASASARVGIRLEHGGPFGASIVRDGVIIACAHNMVLTNKDPTCHAEMTAIRQACKALGTHDLSDCQIYTTCEPCPMCWGAVHWARLNKAYIGVDRFTAAKYGFDDKVFYDEIDGKAGVYGCNIMKRSGFRKDSSTNAAGGEQNSERVEKNMVEIYDGILRKECEELFTNPAVNKTYRRRYLQNGTQPLHQAAIDAFPDAGVKRYMTLESTPDRSLAQHEQFMRLAVAAAERCAKNGMSKEREPFGAVIVKDGTVIATACNSVCYSRDSTATAEVSAIQAATVNLGTYNLEGCEIYTTSQPDVMSLGAILWSRISRAYCGVTQKFAAQYGFEEASLHFKDLLEDPGGKRLIEVVQGVAAEECEAVFKEWSDLNGVIY